MRLKLHSLPLGNSGKLRIRIALQLLHWRSCVVGRLLGIISDRPWTAVDEVSNSAMIAGLWSRYRRRGISRNRA